MPLMPKRVKYRKTQRGSRKGTASRNLRIDFGEFGLQTLERAWITNTQIEAARVALDPQHEAQRQAVDSDFSRQIGDGASAGNANGQRQRSAGVLGGDGAAGQHFV